MTTNYMQFIMSAAALKSLLETEPDYILFNVGADVIEDPKDPEKKVAALAFVADAFKNIDNKPLASASGCPIPPCKSSGN